MWFTGGGTQHQQQQQQQQHQEKLSPTKIASNQTSGGSTNVITSSSSATSSSESGHHNNNNNNNNHQIHHHHHHHHHQHQHQHHKQHHKQDDDRVSFYLKCGIFTKYVTIDLDKMALGLIKQLAISFVNEIYFNSQNYPEKTYIGDYIRKHYYSNDNIQTLIYDRLILRKYVTKNLPPENNKQSTTAANNVVVDSFIPFNSVSDIEQDSYISIEVSEKPLLLPPPAPSSSATTSTHLLSCTHQATSQTATNCSCSSASSQQQQQQHLVTTNNNSPQSNNNNPQLHIINPNQQQQQPNNSNSSNSNNSNNNSNSSRKSCHEFKPESFLFPTHCSACTLLIKGVFRQGFQCHHCKKNFCPKCKQKSESLTEICCAIINQSSSSTITTTTSTTATTTGNSNNHQLQSTPNSSLSTNNSTTSPTTNNNDSDFLASNSGSTQAPQSKLDIAPQHPNMFKRKSASNLLHFNIVFPFKSSHSQQAAANSPTSSGSSSKDDHHQHHQPKTPKTPKGSAGALDPVLQQLGKMRLAAANNNNNNNTNTNTSTEQEQQASKKQKADQQQQQQAQIRTTTTAASSSQAKNNNESESNSNNNLRVTQASHLSSSHQNLYTNARLLENQLSSAKMSYADESLIRFDNDNVTTTAAQAATNNNNNAGFNSASAEQSPVGPGASGPYANLKGGARCCGPEQLSNSARASAHDIHNYHHHHPYNQIISPTKRDQTNFHNFVDLKELTELDFICDVCKKVLKNCSSSSSINKHHQPFICKTCKLRVHSQCQRLVLADCMSRIAESSRQAAERNQSNTSGGILNTTTDNNSETTTDNNNHHHQQQALKNTNSNVSRDNIRLHRLTPSVKHVKRPDSTKPIIEGWLKHTTLSDEQARKHYWRLDETDITLYENDTSTRYFKAIALNKITRVVSAESLPKVVKEDILTSNVLINRNDAAETTSPSCLVGEHGGDKDDNNKAKSANASPSRNSPQLKAQMRAMFAFELATGSMYLVQADNENEANRWKEQLDAITKKRKLEHEEKEKLTASSVVGGPEVSVESKVGQSMDEVASSQRTTEEKKETTTATLNEQQQQQASLNNNINNNNNNNNSKDVGGADKRIMNKETNVNSRPQRQHHHRYPPSIGSGGHYRGGGSHNQQHKTYTDPNRSRLYNRPRITIKIDSFNIPDHLIEGKYLIERDRVKGVGFEELGSGQFGKVYAAISEWKGENPEKGLWSGVPVAIKEISKARFDLRQQAKLKNEANILSRLDHPGVIILERVHDLPDKIYIVMEQLEDDMLEMIVSTEEKRLNERITKFLTYQILEALKYLHSQNIAHCDLKPENVLLVERRSQFPQIKLCDFGFAKIIEENSFRSSLVGTPAYLAPEVVKGERYNRSVDLWSVGVIVYVSLSGEFPFNEGENIHDQISRANFMYPDQPWAKISMQAKNFINSLLRVNCEKRLSANRAQMDDWIQDYQLWCDLSELEVRVGKRWVTDDADFERWSRYAKEHHLQIPRSAIQLHEDLLAD